MDPGVSSFASWVDLRERPCLERIFKVAVGVIGKHANFNVVMVGCVSRIATVECSRGIAPLFLLLALVIDQRLQRGKK